MAEHLLSVRGLSTDFVLDGRTGHAVRDVDLQVDKGEIVGIVGESGSGKSVTALSILRLVPDPPGRIVSGEVHFDGRDLLTLPWAELREIRGRDIAMIFQEPMSALNPVLTIGRQLSEVLEIHEGISKKDALPRIVAALEQVGISEAANRLSAHPHQFSGGMLQRVMIAMALLCRPKLLIADEPTTALDVTIQAQVLRLLLDLRDSDGVSILLITHDLSVVAATCDSVVVMYGGHVQERCTVARLFERPLHPYTLGLIGSIPRPEQKGGDLPVIGGSVPSLFDLPAGCAFCNRCPAADARCEIEVPALLEVEPGHAVRCHRIEEGRSSGSPA